MDSSDGKNWQEEKEVADSQRRCICLVFRGRMGYYSRGGPVFNPIDAAAPVRGWISGAPRGMDGGMDGYGHGDGGCFVGASAGGLSKRPPLPSPRAVCTKIDGEWMHCPLA